MRKTFFGMIFIASFLMPLAANSWDLQQLEDVHNFNCGVFWEVNKEMSNENQITLRQENAMRIMGKSVVEELYAQDRIWVSSGHKSYLREISVKAVPRVGFKIMGQCKKNPSRNMADQVDESFKNFAEQHWNPFTDHELDFLDMDKE